MARGLVGSMARAGLTIALTVACGGGRAIPEPSTSVAEVWVTTPDRSRLLQRDAVAPITSREASDSATVIEVDTAATYQEMIGFGASLTDASAWLIQTRLSPAQRETLLQDLFSPANGIGLGFVRLTIGASDFSRSHYTFDDVPAGETDPRLERFSIEPNRADVLPVVKRALAINPRLAVMATPWSAPAWMKTNGRLIGGTLREKAYGPFADYLRRYIQAYEAEGVPMFAITLQNEPGFEPPDYPGMRLTPHQRAELIARHVGPLFERAGVSAQILDWDHNWDEPGSPLAVLSDTAARRYVAGVAWHCYKGDVAAQTPVHDAFPDKDAYFTECSGGQWAPNWGDNLRWYTRTLTIGATRNWARGVLLWNVALDEANGPHTGGCDDCRGVVTIDSRTGAVTRNEEYYALAHASRFVHPGARRVASSTGIDSLETVAFRNVDDGSKVLIVVNEAAQPRTLVVRAGDRSCHDQIPPGAVATISWSRPARRSHGVGDTVTGSPSLKCPACSTRPARGTSWPGRPPRAPQPACPFVASPSRCGGAYRSSPAPRGPPRLARSSRAPTSSSSTAEC
jgi:glucosylceramidase